MVVGAGEKVGAVVGPKKVPETGGEDGPSDGGGIMLASVDLFGAAIVGAAEPPGS